MPLFSSFINASRSGRRTTSSGNRLGRGTLIQYEQAFRLLSQFESASHTRIEFSLIHRTSVIQHRKLQKEWNLFRFQLSRFLYSDKKVYDQYTGTVLKIIRTVCHYLINEKGLALGPYYKKLKVPVERFRPVVLSPGRLKQLIGDELFKEGLTAAERKVKLILLTGCMLGLRFSDLMKLKKDHLVKQGERSYIILTTGKTGADVTIPLPEKIRLEIAYNTKGSRYLLPRISNSNFNTSVKKLIERAGWVEPCPRFKQRQGKAIEQKKKGRTWRFCDHVTAHTMRRTAITCLLMMGVEEAVVRRLSGHSPGSKEFHKYVILSQTYADEKIREAQEKLLS